MLCDKKCKLKNIFTIIVDIYRIKIDHKLVIDCEFSIFKECLLNTIGSTNRKFC